MTLEYLLTRIPERSYNCEPFGLMMMPCNSDEWSVCYYSHFSKYYDDSKPHIIKNTLLECLEELYAWWLENHPTAIKKQIIHNSLKDLKQDNKNKTT